MWPSTGKHALKWLSIKRVKRTASEQVANSSLTHSNGFRTANTNSGMACSPVWTGWHKWVNGFPINFEQLMKNHGVMLWIIPKEWTNLAWCRLCINKTRKQLNFDKQDFVLLLLEQNLNLKEICLSLLCSAWHPLHLRALFEVAQKSGGFESCLLACFLLTATSMQ